MGVLKLFRECLLPGAKVFLIVKRCNKLMKFDEDFENSVLGIKKSLLENYLSRDKNAFTFEWKFIRFV